MPVYGFKCEPCKKMYDRKEKNDFPCPECGKPVKRSYSLAGIAFKGGGFYTTDKKTGY